MDSSRRVAGQFHPHGSSRLDAGALALAPDGRICLLDADGNEVTRARKAEIRVEAGIGSAPRRVRLPAGQVFLSTDFDGLAEIGLDPKRGGWLHNMEAWRPRLIGVVAACIAFGWMIWRWGLDVLVNIAVAMTPGPVLTMIDTGTLDTLDRFWAYETALSEAEQAPYRAIFSHMVDSLPADEQDRNFTLHFRSAPGIGPNAFALPGGTVVITDEFIKEFPEEDIVASVIGHELGHVVEEHGLKGLYRSLSTYVVIAMIAGDVGPVLQDVLLEGNVLLSLSYSRQNETDADAFGVRLTQRAGYDPEGLVAFFDEVSKYGEAPAGWLATHPKTADRLEHIRTLIDTPE